MKTCPKCGASVKEANFPDHVARVHGKRVTSAGQLRVAVPVRALAMAGVAAALVVGLLLFLQPGPRTGEGPAFTTANPATATVGTGVGNLAPDFLLLDAGDHKVTRETVSPDKPGLIFFTATYCLPCIEGLRQLRRFQDDLGGDSFNVLVTFVDLRETKGDLQAYREKNGFPDKWFYALDQDKVAVKYKVRFLDTKFVLDRDGVIRYSDEVPANYATWQRALGPVLGKAPSTPTPNVSALRFQEFPDQGRNHLGPDESLPAYNSNPPTSGPHFPPWAPCRVSADPVPDGNFVHSLEHGAVAILHRPGLESGLLARLAKIVEGDPSKVLLAPYPGLQGGDIAIAAWTKLDKFNATEFSEERVKAFIAAFRNQGPEPGAPC